MFSETLVEFLDNPASLDNPFLRINLDVSSLGWPPPAPATTKVLWVMNVFSHFPLGEPLSCVPTTVSKETEHKGRT